MNKRTTINDPGYYEITVSGHLDAHRYSWFEGMTSLPQPDGTTIITGYVVDQSALFGLLDHIRDLGMPLLSVQHQKLESSNNS